MVKRALGCSSKGGMNESAVEQRFFVTVKVCDD